MNSIVCIKITPDTAQLRADPKTGRPRLEDAPLRISTFDEHALEEAVRLKESCGGRIDALLLAAAAPPAELILKILAIGADAAYTIVDSSAGGADALSTARILAAAATRLESGGLILCGEGSLDEYNRQVGPRMAEQLEMPVLTHVTRIVLQDGKVIAERSTDGGTEVLECAPPLVVTVGQEINQPRFPSVLQILGASNKPMVTWSPSDLGFPAAVVAQQLAGIETLEDFAPAVARRRIAIPGDDAEQVAAELAKRLFEDGLVKIG
ncbi:MAG TPA: electron transfer flavoprotein subunit beta/FixA family protein [Acidobacteriota bacterium]